MSADTGPQGGYGALISASGDMAAVVDYLDPVGVQAVAPAR
ncbi:hypothetical protein [uncultured Jatrophihabitans sp.]